MYKRLISFALIVLTTAISSAQTGQQSVPVLENESSGLWFVELSSPPAVEGTAPAELERDEQNFHARRDAPRASGMRKDGISENSGTGSRCARSAGDLPKLRALPGVQSVYPV